MRLRTLVSLLGACAVLAGCGGGTHLLSGTSVGTISQTAAPPSTPQGLGFPSVATAPPGDWQAAIAASVLMAPPIRAPLLLSGSSSLPAASADALKALAPS